MDATCWQNNRGYGRHARSLLKALVRLDTESRYTFFMDSMENSQDIPSGVEVRLISARTPAALAASANGHRSLGQMWRMSRAMSASEFDLLFFPTVYSYVPILSRAKKIVMIHDIIAEKYPALTLPSPTARLFWKAKVALGRRQADAIATVSDYSREGILKHFKIAPERVFVVGEAMDPAFRMLENPRPTDRLAALGVPSSGRLVAYVGGFNPHKNLETLVSAFAKLAARREFSDLRLVMAGEYEKEVFHGNYRAIKRQVEHSGISDRVIFTGHLADDDLVALLNLTTVLVLPSLIEGFGLPAVEAAACGCPVIATTASPLPQILGEGGLYIDPARPQELESALARVLCSGQLRLGMREAGLAAASRLSWEAAAGQMIDLMRRVLAP